MMEFSKYEEMAREYVEWLGTSYDKHDVAKLAALLARVEREALERAADELEITMGRSGLPAAERIRALIGGES
jgi:hypothetical protein